jgi:membrane-associated protease RseP (regulator of RpoE activity)
MDIEMSGDGARVLSVHANGPAANAGVKKDDLITAIDGTPLAGLKIEEVIGRLRGAAGSEVQLKVARARLDGPLLFTLARAPIRIPGVELEVRIDGGKLAAEATGRWPVLDFEQGKPLVLAPASPDEFYVDGEDHTRLAFVRDTQGGISGAILNPGPWQLNGERIAQ